MNPSSPNLPPARDPLLFTPGPLTTSLTVKMAMLHDAGSWHADFNALVARIREELLTLGGISREMGYECIPLQGTGTFGVEAVFASALPENGKLLILANGAYGDRMIQMAKALRRPHTVLTSAESATPDLSAVQAALDEDAAITHVSVVHCETTTGILNPIHKIGGVVRAAGRRYIVDAMSSFGALPIDIPGSGIDFLISSANKCLEGVPGFSFVLARRAALLEAEGCARSLSLDLLGQLRGFERNGQFRYTPPTHAVLAFSQALRELANEGGIPARRARYERNHTVLLAGMARLGWQPFLDPAVQSCIITSFPYPKAPGFSFPAFYEFLSRRGFIIYPGKLTKVDTFRIGTIGRLFEADILGLLGAIRESLREMNVPLNGAD